jgi:hypothetical protein
MKLIFRVIQDILYYRRVKQVSWRMAMKLSKPWR